MKKNHGLTLAELLITLSILAIISVAGISFFLFPNKVFDNIIVQGTMEYDVNGVLREMVKEIRAATNPDPATDAIVIFNSDEVVALSGNRIDIYHYRNNRYYKVSYRFSNGNLEKGIIERNTEQEITNASVNNYSVILSDIVFPSGGEIFQDITTDSKENSRKTISINLIAQDETGRFITSQNRPLTVTTRTKIYP